MCPPTPPNNFFIFVNWKKTKENTLPLRNVRLQLSKKVPVKSKTIKTIKLAETRMRIKDNGTCWVAGWGITEHRGSLATELQKVDVRYMNLDKCKYEWQQHTKENLPDTVLCAGGFTEDGKGFCQVRTRVRKCGDAESPAVPNEPSHPPPPPPPHRATLVDPSCATARLSASCLSIWEEDVIILTCPTSTPTCQSTFAGSTRSARRRHVKFENMPGLHRLALKNANLEMSAEVYFWNETGTSLFVCFSSKHAFQKRYCLPRFSRAVLTVWAEYCSWLIEIKMINLSRFIYPTRGKTANRSQGQGENAQHQSTTYWTLSHWEEALKWRKSAAVVFSCSCPYMANTEIVTQQDLQSTVVHTLRMLTKRFSQSRTVSYHAI